MSVAGQRIFPSYTHHLKKNTLISFRACPLYDLYLFISYKENVIKFEGRKLTVVNILNEFTELKRFSYRFRELRFTIAIYYNRHNIFK